MAGNVVALTRGEETIELTDAEQSCAILQTELKVLAANHHRGPFNEVAARAGICTETVWRLAYGETTRPQHRTVINLFLALGWRLWASR